MGRLRKFKPVLTCIIIVSLTSFPAWLMLILICAYSVHPPDAGTALYTRLNVTNVLIPSTFISTVALLLAGSTLKLASLPSAWRWLHPRSNNTPTAGEVRVASSLVSKPDVMALLSFLRLVRRKIARRETRTQLPCMLILPGITTFFVVFLGWFLFLCDNWLHTVASSVQVTLESVVVNGTTINLAWSMHPDSSDPSKVILDPRAMPYPEYVFRWNYSSLFSLIGSMIGFVPFGNRTYLSRRSVAVQTQYEAVDQQCGNNPYHPQPSYNCSSINRKAVSRRTRSGALFIWNVTSGEPLPWGSPYNPIQYILILYLQI